MTASTPTFKAGKAWLVTIVSILCSLCMAMITFKAMTTAPLIMEYFAVDIGTYGAVTAAVGALSIVGAIPAGAILAKLGPRKLVLICLICSAISGYLQIFSLSLGASYITFMVIGGLGAFVYGMWTVNGPMLVSAWFPAEKRGLPNSISTAWVSIAMLILLTVSSPLILMAGINPETGDANAVGFVNVWWLMSISLTVAAVLAFLFVRMPKIENCFVPVSGADGAPKGKVSDGLKNGGMWMLLLTFLAYGFITAAYGNYFPTYLNAPVEESGLGMMLADANMLSSVTTYVMIAMNFVYGFVLNKIPNKRYGTFGILVAVLTAAVGIVMFLMPSTSVVAPYLIIYGIVSQLYPPLCWTVLPEVCESQEEMASCMGIISVCANISGVGATYVVAAVQGAFGNWQSIAIPMGVLGVLGIITAIMFVGIYRKKYAEHHPEEVAA